MKAIERMAEAAWDKAANGLSTWDGLSQYGRELHISAMRVAILALANVELPKEIRQAGAEQLELSDEVKADVWMDMGDAFRAMLRHLATEDFGVMPSAEQAEQSVSPDKPALQTENDREAE